MGPSRRIAKDNAGEELSAPVSNINKTSSESRKLRNRLSQKAFRARQAMRIKELEEQLGTESTPDAIQTAQLRDRNAALRNQLLDCHKKITSLQISMNMLAESTALALGLEPSGDAIRVSASEQHLSDKLSRQPQQRRCSRCSSTNDAEDRHISSDEGYSSHTSRHDYDLIEEEPYGHAETDLDGMHMSDNEPVLVPEVPPVLDFCGLSDDFALPLGENRQMLGHYGNIEFIPAPQIRSFSCSDMGMGQYADLVSRSQLLDSHSRTGLRRTNSLFSDHLDAVEYFLHQKRLKRGLGNSKEAQFMASVKFMLSSFVSVSWRMLTAWYTYTKAHIPLQELTAWRVSQTPEAYMKIIPSYRPTQLQMSTQHPAIIDWIPWATLRDKLILYHCANPCLDSIICDMGNSFVVPCNLSTLVAGLPAMMGYISVWDLVRAIAPDATSPDDNCTQCTTHHALSGYCQTANGTYAYFNDPAQTILVDDDAAQKPLSDISLPAPDKATLFSSKKLATQAFQALGMDRGAATWYLDPMFFSRHPELYDPQCNIMATGVPLRPDTHISFPICRELDSSVVGQYRELTRWTFDHTSDD